MNSIPGCPTLSSNFEGWQRARGERFSAVGIPMMTPDCEAGARDSTKQAFAQENEADLLYERAKLLRVQGIAHVE